MAAAKRVKCWLGRTARIGALRISVADIEAHGPFSNFEGVDRWFGVLQGEGVRLDQCELRSG